MKKPMRAQTPMKTAARNPNWIIAQPSPNPINTPTVLPCISVSPCLCGRALPHPPPRFREWRDLGEDRDAVDGAAEVVLQGRADLRLDLARELGHAGGR